MMGSAMPSKAASTSNAAYYFAGYGSHPQQKANSATQLSSGSGKKRVDKLKVTSSGGNHPDHLSAKQAIMLAAMQSKGASKMSANTGHSSSKGSTLSKVPSTSQRNEYRSSQQPKS